MCLAHSLSLCYSLFDLSPFRPFSIPPSLPLSLSLSLSLPLRCVIVGKEGGQDFDAWGQPWDSSCEAEGMGTKDSGSDFAQWLLKVQRTHARMHARAYYNSLSLSLSLSLSQSLSLSLSLSTYEYEISRSNTCMHARPYYIYTLYMYICILRF